MGNPLDGKGLSLLVEKSRSVQKFLVGDPGPSTTAIGLKCTRSKPNGTAILKSPARATFLAAVGKPS